MPSNFKLEKIIPPVTPKAKYHVSTTGAEEFQLVKKLEFSAADYRALANHLRQRGSLLTPHTEYAAV
jgi:hypothetical protein